MTVDESGPAGVPRTTWSALGAMVALHPLILYVRAALRDGFSDSGVLGGTFSFILFTVGFTVVVGGLFTPALLTAVDEGVVTRLRFSVIGLGVGTAHVAAAVGVSSTGSNWWWLAYPILAVLVVPILELLRRRR